MKFKVSVNLFTVVILFAASCLLSFDNNPKVNDKKDFDGWAGPPEDPNKSPFEYYYMKRVNNVSPKVNRPLSEEICSNSIKVITRVEFFWKMVDENGHPWIEPAECRPNKWTVNEKVRAELNRKIKPLSIKDCRPLRKPNLETPGMEWTECECTVFAHIPSGNEAIRARMEELERKCFQ